MHSVNYRRKRKYKVYRYSVELDRKPLGGYDSQGQPITDLYTILKNGLLKNDNSKQSHVISNKVYHATRREVFEDTLKVGGEDVALGYLKGQYELDELFGDLGKDDLSDLYKKYAAKLDNLKVV